MQALGKEMAQTLAAGEAAKEAGMEGYRDTCVNKVLQRLSQRVLSKGFSTWAMQAEALKQLRVAARRIVVRAPTQQAPCVARIDSNPCMTGNVYMFLRRG